MTCKNCEERLKSEGIMKMTADQTQWQCPKCMAWQHVGNYYAVLQPEEYIYKTLEEYEAVIGVKVNNAVHVGWTMARVTKNEIKTNQSS